MASSKAGARVGGPGWQRVYLNRRNQDKEEQKDMDSHPTTQQAIEKEVKKGIQAGWRWYMTLIPALSRGRSRHLRELEANLVYKSEFKDPAWKNQRLR